MAPLSIVVDTNIYISAILFGGKPEQILHLARSGKIRVFISPQILHEIVEVLKVKFDWNEDQLAEVEAEIENLTHKVEPRTGIKFVKSDLEDNKFLEVAVESKSQLIISGDKHLLDLKSFKNIKIITITEFLNYCSRL